MKLDDIAVRVVGPGSQPGDEQALSYINMPDDMSRYSPPQLSGLEQLNELPDVREVVRWLRAALSRYTAGSQPQLADLSRLDDRCRELVNQILGEGEVCITCTAEPGARIPHAKTQESVLAGVWRSVFIGSGDTVLCDLLEVADVPTIVGNATHAICPVDTSVPADTTGIVNALPILVELDAAAADYAERGETHSINLSLLPLSETELAFLDERLGRGSVDILSRAYGKCRIISTLTANVWWVRYFNSMGTLILNLLEVTAVPDIVKAAAEDLADSRTRLDGILAPYWQDLE